MAIINYVVHDSKEECEDLISRIDAFLGYPNSSVSSYGVPHKHLIGDKWALILKSTYSAKLDRYSTWEDVESNLEPDEYSKIMTRDQLIELGWFAEKE